MIKIMADSTCDLSQEVLDQYDIQVAPLTVTMDGKTYRDKIDITADEFYSMMEKLDKKFDNITEEEEISSTYLVKRKESKLFKLFRYIKHVLLKKEFENDN